MDFQAAFISFCTEKTSAPCKLRLAPTPSGLLHIGNALNFIFNALLAKMQHGTLLLRIDDMDSERCRPAYLQDIFDTLHWLQIEWEEGPKDPGDFERNWSQQQRMSLYQQALAQLAQGGQVYACLKSRKELAEYAPDLPPDIRIQGISLQAEGCAWRLKTPAQLAMQDFIVRKKDGMPAYQLSSVCDDVHFGITHIVRGADLQPSSEAQQHLAQVLDFQIFKKVKIIHHPLIQDAAGQKLSKSRGAVSLQAMRDAGHSPAFIYQKAANWLGISNEDIKNLTDLVAAFQQIHPTKA